MRIISGHQLNRGIKSFNNKVLSPYITVDISGFPLDTGVSLKTQTISENSFNPSWNETISFPLRVPEIALLQIIVYNGGTFPNEHIGHCIFPVEFLKEGYRAFPLYNEDDQLIDKSTIFCHIKFNSSSLKQKSQASKDLNNNTQEIT